jgi:hypothetical protein
MSAWQRRTQLLEKLGSVSARLVFPPHPPREGEMRAWPSRAEKLGSVSARLVFPPHVLKSPLLTFVFCCSRVDNYRQPLAFRGRFHLCFFFRGTRCSDRSVRRHAAYETYDVWASIARHRDRVAKVMK